MFKKSLLIVIISFVMALPCNAKIKQEISNITTDNVTVDGVIYKIKDETSASCKASPKKKNNIRQLSIQNRVLINNKGYIVKEIEEKGFEGCSHLQSLTIPASIDTVGCLAFRDCRNLETINFLSKNITFLLTPFKFFGAIGPFYGCRKLQNVYWPDNTIPLSAFKAFTDKSIPYRKWLDSHEAEIIAKNAKDRSGISGDLSSKPSFSDFANSKISEVYNKWVKKKPYESVVQYRQRTSAEECEARKRELFENARNEYINLYAPTVLSGTIADYDADYKVFTIDVQGGMQVFAQVPQADKTFFEDNFPGVTIKPTYNIVKNELAIVDCRFEIGDRTYNSPEIYDGVADDFSSIDFEARKLDFNDLLAEENEQKQAAAAKASAKTARKQSLGAVDMAPSTGYNNRNTYALVIGNENYKYNDPVKYATADAVTFARYCRNTLGVPSENILAVQDVTKGELRRTVREVQALFEDEGENKSLIVYYAGHGIPDQNGIDSYILPVDASATDIESCYSLQEFYNQLGELPARSVVVYLDACFTGSSRTGSQLVAARAGVSFERSAVEPRGNTVVFAATSANETAQPYDEAGHGIFTYYLLDKLKQTKGEITLGNLSQYLITKVKAQSVSKGKKRQVPSMLVSPSFSGDWKNLPVNLMK